MQAYTDCYTNFRFLSAGVLLPGTLLIALLKSLQLALRKLGKENAAILTTAFIVRNLSLTHQSHIFCPLLEDSGKLTCLLAGSVKSQKHCSLYSLTQYFWQYPFVQNLGKYNS